MEHYLTIYCETCGNEVKKENERLREELEIFKTKELNVEYLTNQNKNLQKILEFFFMIVQAKLI